MFGMHNLRVMISYGGHQKKIMLKRESWEKPQQNEVFNHIFVPARTDSMWVEVNLQNLFK